MAGAAARWLLPLRAGRRCVSPAVTSAALPVTKKPRHKDNTGDVCSRTAPHPEQ